MRCAKGLLQRTAASPTGETAVIDVIEYCRIMAPLQRRLRLSKKWPCHFFEKGFAAFCASVVR